MTFEPDTDPIPLEGYGEEKSFESAPELLAFLGSDQFRLSRWVFRGQPDNRWPLQPTLERFAIKIRDLPERVERFGLTEFRRQAHHYATITPDNTLEWLALMRHHGAPSRLLDFTKSPYIAAFFAAAEAALDQSAAIWAIDALAIKRHAGLLLSTQYVTVVRKELGKRCLTEAGFSFSDPAEFSAFIAGGLQARVVVPVEPFRTNERMLLQRGLFLCPDTLSTGFEAVLKNVVRHAKQDPETQTPVLYKITITPKAHPFVLRELHRMNINHASLFPGLDGLALSLTSVSKIAATTVPANRSPDYEFEQVRF